MIEPVTAPVPTNAPPRDPDRESVIRSLTAVVNYHGLDNWIGSADSTIAQALYGRLLQYRRARTEEGTNADLL